ncbi:SixA phosphatase family protein [Salinimicrobium sp. GXAS 041]|uniref:SixA phosphatase family protein n=1 Tax=Salinimicrobium sp. GXAS 041 TaxID=3400806 RepID=UPI003C73FE4A
MKKLILGRHGKSSWKQDLPDDERPLKKRAYKDADLVIKGLKSVLKKPFLIWTSYAERAKTTAGIFKNKFKVEDEHFQIKEDLYTFNQKELLEVIESCDDDVAQLMVFGHNPAMTSLVNSLGDKTFGNVPTTGLVVIEFESNSWKNLKNGKTLLYLFPKNLR